MSLASVHVYSHKILEIMEIRVPCVDGFGRSLEETELKFLSLVQDIVKVVKGPQLNWRILDVFGGLRVGF